MNRHRTHFHVTELLHTFCDNLLFDEYVFLQKSLNDVRGEKNCMFMNINL